MRSVTPARENTSHALTLSNAVEAGDAARVSALLSAGARADEPSRAGETPLMRAAARGYEDVALALLEAGADANARRADGFTPLVLATFFGHERLVRLLITYGADADAETRLGTNAKRWADARGFHRIAELLRDAKPARAVARKSEETSAFNAGGAGDEFDAKVFAGKFVDVAPKASGADESKSAASELKNSASELKKDAAGEFKDTDSDFGEKTAVAVGAVKVSVRHEGETPAHPSAKAFRLGGFMRSWQASVGTAMLLTAFGVAAYAVWRNRPPRENSQPAQAAQTPAPQAAAQPPTPAAYAAPVEQPSPLLSPTPVTPTPGLVPPDATYVAPNPASQPYYVPPAGSNPSIPVVVSESDSPAPAADAARQKSKNNNATNDSSQDAGHDAPAASNNDNSRPARNGRTQDAETPPPAPSAKPTPASPAPTPTPERRKVIPWPPQ